MAKEKQCPYRFGMPEKQRGCIEHQCALYQRVTGLHPQTALPIDEYACALAWLPMLIINQAGETIKAAKSVDKVATILFGGMSPQARERIIAENPTLLPAPPEPSTKPKEITDANTQPTV